MPDRFHGNARPQTVPEGTPRDHSATTTPRPYRGCSRSFPRAGTARTAPVWILRAAGHRHPPVPPIRLDLGAMAWAGVPCWSGGAKRWAQETVPIAYALRYATHVRPAMPGNPISLKTLLRVAEARARYAEHHTGRNCRASNATLAACAGVSVRTVQRATTALRLLGVATEVLRGRQRSRNERMASWRVEDRGRGWASVWALHDSRFPQLSPHPGGTPVRDKNSRKEELTTPTRRRSAGSGAASQRQCPDAPTLALANRWINDRQSPPWARRYRTPAAWARILAGPAAYGWTARDINQLITDWLGTGHWIPDRPHKPIGLLGAILAWHGPENLADRPAAAEEAREAAELAAEQQRKAANAIERAAHQRARSAAQAAAQGPGRAAARAQAAAIARRALERRTETAARDAAHFDATVRAARELDPWPPAARPRDHR
jgi:hypothetical protein